jgi:hypothetical protein
LLIIILAEASIVRYPPGRRNQQIGGVTVF